MKILRQVSEARHYLALATLALIMSVFASAAGKAAMQSRSKTYDDPVIRSMSWEQLTISESRAIVGDGPIVICGVNCPNGCPTTCEPNCPPNSPSNCPPNSPSNCPTTCDPNCPINCDSNCNANCDSSCNGSC